MKRTILILALLLLVLLTACGGDTDSEQPNTNPDGSNPPLESVDIVTEPATVAAPGLPAPTGTPDPYLGMEPTAAPDAYPAEPATESNLPAYPATGTIWVIRPLGQQCQQATEYEYKTIEEAVQALDDAGVAVYANDKILLTGCESCDCPTSEHYRVRIDESNLEQARALGWEVEE